MKIVHRALTVLTHFTHAFTVWVSTNFIVSTKIFELMPHLSYIHVHCIHPVQHLCREYFPMKINARVILGLKLATPIYVGNCIQV